MGPSSNGLDAGPAQKFWQKFRDFPQESERPDYGRAMSSTARCVPGPRLRRLLRNLAAQDLCVLAYLTYQGVRLFRLPDSSEAREARPPLLILSAVALFSITLVRSELLPAGRRRALLYRIGMVFSVVGCYLAMRPYLLAHRARLLDGSLLAIDRALFGETPALVWQRFATPAAVEWFAFFYFSYYALQVLNVLGSALLDDGERVTELLVGAMLVACLGYVGYTLVPGIGPYAALSFERELRGYLFFGLVLDTVRSAGAQLDIFPSLHTGLPTLFALHAIRHRGRPPFRYVWPISALFAFNIIIATLFLRWHYAIDVVAGFTLAVLAQQIAIRVARRDRARLAAGLQPGFEPLWRRSYPP